LRRTGSSEIAYRGSSKPEVRHRLDLNGLAPGTRYEYRLERDASWSSFSTVPDTPVPFTFAVLGDIGDGSAAESLVIGTLQQHQPAFAVALGDLAYPVARERALTQRFFLPTAAYAGEHVIWHVFGNHDVAGDGGKPLDLASVTPRNGPRGLPADRNYSFEYGDAHFSVVDTNLARADLQSLVVPWLRKDLASTRRRWKFVMMHHPAYSTGRHHDSRKVKRALVPVLRAAKVDAVFAGHDHNYQRYKPVGGVTYIVSGGGGAGLYHFERSSRQIAARDDRHHGLTLVDVTDSGVHLRHLGEKGTVLDQCVLPAHGERMPHPATRPR
jgi:3',5'-cyclic AMP phosphodiesterase CpdA